MRGRLIIAVAAAIGAAASCASSQPATVEIPPALNPDRLAVYLEVAATGVQIYRCGKTASGAWAWIFKAPEAALSDGKSKPLGKHYAGPTWEGLDGGMVLGAVKAQLAAPDGKSIPWVLLEVKSREGSGAFTKAKAIVRASTSGGAAPGQGCDEARSGSEIRIPYSATYAFLN